MDISDEDYLIEATILDDQRREQRLLERELDESELYGEFGEVAYDSEESSCDKMPGKRAPILRTCCQ